MITTGFETRIKVQQIVQNQLPEFILDESPKVSDFLKQYYISQEYQGGPVDLTDNLDQYLKLDNLTPEVIVGFTTTTAAINSTQQTINVSSTKGFPNSYGLLKIDDEIITYTGTTPTSFTGCVRGFSGITNFHQDLNSEELVFEQTQAAPHTTNSSVENLSVLFLQEFYKKIKYSLTPGLQDVDFVSDLNVGNFIKEARSFYRAKGTEESFRILFNVLFGVTPRVIDLEQYLIKTSDASYIRREVALAESFSGNPNNLIGQTIRKQGDDSTSAAVSEVEIISRGGKTYYKLSIFVGYDDSTSFITGNFLITPSTKILEAITSGSSIVTVDSTIGFPRSGSIFYVDTSTNTTYEIFYEDKSINQFFGCYTKGSSTININVPIASTVTTSEIYYGYENGDTTKKVELRVTGVLSDIIVSSGYYFDFIEGDEIYVKNLGDLIKLSNEKTYKQILANSWIYNTRSRYQIESFSGSTITTKSSIESVSLKKGDYIEILLRDDETVISGLSNVEVVDIIDKTVYLSTSATLDPTQKYDLRRKLNKSSSSSVPIEFSPGVLSDVQNTYSQENDYLYVATNSLPSYDITTDVFKYPVLSIPLSGYDSELGKSSIIEFNQEVSFITGDRVYYEASQNPIEGLEKNTSYYVEVLSGRKTIRLYTSSSFVGSEQFILIGDYTRALPAGSHTFVLYSQKEAVISPQEILRKIKIEPNIGNITKSEVIPGPLGMMVNGVEILSYKTNDKIYYGSIESVNVLNGGDGFDIINPPVLSLSSGSAKIQPVLSGSVEKVYVDPQDFDVEVSVSIAMSGGNGSGASFEPLIRVSSREMSFDAREITNGGGLDINAETITFLGNHSLIDTQRIFYDRNGNSSLGISSVFGGLNASQNLFLIDKGPYYVKVVNDKTIRLHPTFLDSVLGINTVGFTTINTGGIHKFKTEPKKSLSEIVVTNGGSGYQNRKLIVKNSGISSANYSINFKNHGFSDGDLVTYTYQTSAISGLSSTSQYFVLKIDDDSFRVCDAGIGGTSSTNYDRKNYVKFSSTGSGYQIFSYPPISLQVTYTSLGIATDAYRGEINATPVVKGEITDVYVYESGSDYGSNVINVKKTPQIEIKNGKFAQLRPTITNGQITGVQILFGGNEYFSVPELSVIGDGTGATLRAVVSNGRVTQVIVVNPGTGYTLENTTILVTPSGKNAKFDIDIRSLTVNNSYKYGIQEPLYRSPASEVLISSTNNLQYYVSGYYQGLLDYFEDDGTKHSPIIGWAYDGNPIYGPYGYEEADNPSSTPTLLQSGYSLVSVENRPAGFDNGFFIEDYRYTGNGDLDEYNGRYCKTPEFPNGVYAYFATVEQNPSGDYVGKFPYFVGNYYRSEFSDTEVLLNQSFDFIGSNLLRNTHPYKLNDLYAGNDFIVESNELVKQKTVVESVFPGNISGFDIVSPGESYRIGDELAFAVTGSRDDLVVSAVELEGKQISSVQTSLVTYNNAVLTWQNGDTVKVTIPPYHNLIDGDRVTISGLSTSLSTLSGAYRVGVSTLTTTLSESFDDYPVTGIVTDIFVSSVPNNISAGSSIKIDSEIMTVLNTYNGILRIRRYSGATSSHSASSPIYFLPDSFTISKKTSVFDSKLDDKIYFNPTKSVGVGTTSGITNEISYTIGDIQSTVSVPTQSIYIPNHPFVSNQRVTVRRPSGASDINYSLTSSSATLSLFGISNNETTLYVVNKSKDFIGLTTAVGLTTTGGVYFLSSGDDNYEYSIESNFYKETVTVENNRTIVSTASTHGLTDGDSVRLSIEPNLNVGIGTSTSIRVKYNDSKSFVLINPTGISTSNINITNNTITIPSHGLKSGEKVLYSSGGSAAGGLENGKTYFVRRINNSTINLCESYVDSISLDAEVIDITSLGGNSQEISRINPEIKVIKNNNVVFNLSDSSLQGCQFKIYYDEQFNKEFVSAGSTNTFTVTGIGTVGVSTNASLTINYFESLPERLFYNIEKGGFISTSDRDVINRSQIIFANSEYSNTYTISGIGSTSFGISLKNDPEKLSYLPSECDTIKYYTTSNSAFGGISKVKILSSSQYKEIPRFTGNKKSSTGVGAYLIAKSENIGKLKQTRIINGGFDYSSDKTLRPTALLPNVVSIESSNTIKSVSVDFGGTNYITPPNVVIVDSSTGELIETGDLRATLRGSTIESVSVLSSPSGLPPIPVQIRTTNNSNGIAINQIQSSSSGLVTCFLVTPLSGFSTDPFSTGDKIWVEGISKSGVEGTGFNSSDYGYTFLTVSNYYSNSNPGKLEYNLAGLTTNPGIAKTVQDAFASIISLENYPRFTVQQEHSDFFIGETVSSDNGFGYQNRDLVVTFSNENFVRLVGSYQLSKGEKIRGDESKNVATVNAVKLTEGSFIVESTKRETSGWKKDTGKLSEDSQVLSDNDYYQNLSYSVKSPKEWEEIVTPVNRLLHTSGLKNFSDTQLLNNASFYVGVGTTGAAEEPTVDLINNFIDERRIDTINNFQLVVDTDVNPNINPPSSKFIRFDNLKLSDYIEVRTNRVLSINDISDLFSSIEDSNPDFSSIYILNDTLRFNRFLIQTIGTSEESEKKVELTELVTLNDNLNVFSLKKGNITSENISMGDYYGDIDELDNILYLKFDAKEKYNLNHAIKYVHTEYIGGSALTEDEDVGFVKLLSTNNTVGVGTTANILSLDSSKFTSFYANIAVVCTNLNDMNYVELYVTHDDSDSYVAELYFDSTDSESSQRFIGTFSSYLSSGLLKLDFYNTFSDEVNIISKVVGFGTTAVGVGTHRFKLSGQPNGSERTVIYSTNYTNTTGVNTSTVLEFDKDLFSSSKATVKIGVGDTSVLHQVLLVHDGNDIYTTQYPFLSVNNTLGVGSFGAEYSGNNVQLKFYPDPGTSGNVEILSFSEQFYQDLDGVNIPPSFEYGSVRDTIRVTNVYGLNLDDINRKDFPLYYQEYPIFMKTVDPSDTSVFNTQTGIFNVPNHFFSTGEELIYRPTSTFIGIAGSAMGIVPTLNYLGISTTRLPSKVYAIKVNNDQFKIATRKEYAQSGTAVTFTDVGTGNAHEFEMFKKNEKSLISVSNLIQYPIAYTALNFQLSNNIGAANTTFALTGISSVNPKDVLRVDDEYMLINNVGLGTSSVGPITFTGNFSLVEVERGSLGSAATSHTGMTDSRIYRGSYNISKNTIYFTDPPRGGGFYITDKDESNLTREKASFNGRVFLRKDYTSNQVYDSISEQFTGIGATYTLTAQGINTVGLGTSGGNGVLFINSIFQAPTTENNSNNNFAIIEVVSTSGVTSVIFSGITDENGDIVLSEYDVNQNQLPRGGMIVSLGSTIGLGYAPLVGANVAARLSGLGTITSIELPPLVVSGRYADASRLILQNKRLIAEESVGRMLSAFPGFAVPGGNIQCEDDIVTVLESVAFNLQYGGNDLVYDAGQIYITNDYLKGEEDESIYAFQQASSLAINAIRNIGIGTSTPATIGITTTRITGINTLGISVGNQVRTLPNLIQNDTSITQIGIGSIFINKPSLNTGSITTSITISQYSTLPQYFDFTIEGDISGLPGVYNSNDCANAASAINSFVGIVTTAIGIGTLPANRTQVNQPGSFGSGYRGPVSVAVTDPFHTGTAASITASVGAGGTLTFTINNGGSGYVSPTFLIPPPVYENMEVEGVFRVGIGTTTETGVGLLMNVEVGVSDRVGIGSSFFEITGFKIKRPGYGFRRGDRFRPVGLVTAKGLSQPIIPFELTVLDVYNDSFASWQFGELNYIDSIKNYQDGQRTRFPLLYNAQLLSFETNQNDPDSQLIDFDSLLLIFINGVLQEPKVAYQFSGGTSFTFTDPPKPSDNISVFFYLGTSGEDSVQVNVTETIKPGDELQILSSNSLLQSTKIQDPRVVIDISSSDKLETNLYSNQGVDDINLRPVSWTKQKTDLFINNTIISKSRDSIEPQVYPTAKVIKNFSASTNEIFVDNADFFNYEEESPISFASIIVANSSDPVSAAITAIVSAAGTISSLVVNDPGSGYTGSFVNVEFSSPSISRVSVGKTSSIASVGVGTTASATIQVIGGSLSGIVTITNPGFGYTFTAPPQVISPLPAPQVEIVESCSSIVGYDGVIVGIETTTGVGVPLALKFTLARDPLTFPHLSVGYPLYITDTTVGRGVTSVDTSNNSIVGVGTTCLDNIYYIHAFDSSTGIATCNIRSNTSIVGIATTGSFEYPVGRFSWGRISGFTRSSNPVSVAVTGRTVTSGLGTYPTIQRRDFGLRSTGALKKQIN